MATMLAWGFVACLSPALMPSSGPIDSVGIEYAYYASQLTLLVLGACAPAVMRRWRPSVPPAAVAAASAVLACTTAAVCALSVTAGVRPHVVTVALQAACGVAYGACGLLLTVVWGARLTLEGERARLLALTSFLLCYVLYLASFLMPQALLRAAAVLAPLVSGGAWLYDSWRRSAESPEVWPTGGGASHEPGGESLGAPGEASAGEIALSILPWRQLVLYATVALVGNFVPAYVMGSSYARAGSIFPGASAVALGLALVAVPIVRPGAGPRSLDRFYRLVLPVAALGMLVAAVSPLGQAGVPDGVGTSGVVVVAGASMTIQMTTMLAVVQSTQLTGVSPLLSFSVGQGVVGGVVAIGNVLGRLAWAVLPGVASPLGTTWLALFCAAGVFCLLLLALAPGTQARPAGRVEERPGAVAGGGATGAREGADPAGAGLDDEAFDARVAAFAADAGLTPRETDVLGLLLRGHSVASIGERLFVTAGTAKTHVLHIYRKVGVNSRQGLIDRFERNAAGRGGAA
ncbi:MAG: helix-turn-helix transcriptional regulator [Coriobacteriales bacterium]|jgi:DNA-binding CsgD family transcriptional regulator